MLHRYLEGIGNHLKDVETYLRGFERVVQSFGNSDLDDEKDEVVKKEVDVEAGQNGKTKDGVVDSREIEEEITKSSGLRSKVIAVQQSRTFPSFLELPRI